MVFSSLIFLFLFLPACLILYYATPWLKLRNWILILFSLLFYAWGEPVWVVLLLASAVIDYCNGLFIEKFRGKPLAVLGVYSTILINVGALATFKYSGFIVENVNTITGLNMPKPSFLLPVGISFYVFMSISYTLDVYRNELRAQRSFPDFLVYIANFHHLVAGPIIRYGHIAHEITSRRFRLGDFSSGASRFCIGLFKKVCIANVAGELATQFLDGDPEMATLAGAWFGLLMFTLQIYFDFSGYSDMAIGLGRMFGFHYRENFDHPYIARSITDFWRRWHISLSSFFRDYVYIPLGGNRHHQVRNILVVWALTGIWHGASWNFVLWGLYFAVLLLVEKRVLGSVLPRLPRFFQHAYAMFFIILGWAIFYFTDIHRLGQFLQSLFGLRALPFTNFEVANALTSNAFWLIFALLACWPMREWYHKNAMAKAPAAIVVLSEALISLVFFFAAITMLVGSSYNPFIYFRF
jgi:alginate O-acetyltransferase complex protein AlgI